MVIPHMNILDEFLTTQSIDSNLKRSVRATCSLAKQTLNRYYSKTDLSDLYCIAMSESPHSDYLCALTDIRFSSSPQPQT